ncbi:MAG: uroporphyrinogen-III synthase [Candidatus Azotimanducaceae bacterium]|jgi:uroporphyrinogen-III synthase|tara:strand:- start:24520 stop:25239 length:720 start_codon:yes stop_codon:yes gene_type:complete
MAETVTKVWITLTQPGASRIAAQLASEGYECICESVTEIQLLPLRLTPITNNVVPDLCIFLSQHAAKQYLQEVYCEAHSACKFLAVGPSTAKVLRQSGLQVLEPEHASSEGLLACATVQNIKAGERVWLVCGEGGRDILHKSLAKRCHLSVLNLYRRINPSIKNARVIDADIILVGSYQGFVAAAKTWQELGGSLSASFVVPSQRVADLSLELGFTRVVNARGLDTQSLLKALARIKNA